jgi:hypothetical protein
MVPAPATTVAAGMRLRRATARSRAAARASCCFCCLCSRSAWADAPLVTSDAMRCALHVAWSTRETSGRAGWPLETAAGGAADGATTAGGDSGPRHRGRGRAGHGCVPHWAARQLLSEALARGQVEGPRSGMAQGLTHLCVGTWWRTPPEPAHQGSPSVRGATGGRAVGSRCVCAGCTPRVRQLATCWTDDGSAGMRSCGAGWSLVAAPQAQKLRLWDPVRRLVVRGLNGGQA